MSSTVASLEALVDAMNASFDLEVDFSDSEEDAVFNDRQLTCKRPYPPPAGNRICPAQRRAPTYDSQKTRWDFHFSANDTVPRIPVKQDPPKLSREAAWEAALKRQGELKKKIVERKKELAKEKYLQFMSGSTSLCDGSFDPMKYKYPPHPVWSPPKQRSNSVNTNRRNFYFKPVEKAACSPVGSPPPLDLTESGAVTSFSIPPAMPQENSRLNTTANSFGAGDSWNPGKANVSQTHINDLTVASDNSIFVDSGLGTSIDERYLRRYSKVSEARALRNSQYLEPTGSALDGLKKYMLYYNGTRAFGALPNLSRVQLCNRFPGVDMLTLFRPMCAIPVDALLGFKPAPEN